MTQIYFDKAEAQDPLFRQSGLMAKLRKQLVHAKTHSSFWQETLDTIDPETIQSRDDLVKLPILRKSDLVALQAERDLFGGIATDKSAIKRVFFSPGPIVEPQANIEDPWRMASALYAAGMRPGDVIANCFSYHLTPAGFMFDEAAAKLGATVFPAGVGNTETLVDAFNHFQISGYVGTPDFLQIILEKAKALGKDIKCVKHALVSGGPLFPAMRAFYQSENIDVRQCYGTAELGLIAYETQGEGLVIAEDCMVEIVRPGTGDPVNEGEVGEVVVSIFNPTYPLIRFATGDLSAILPGQSECGRTNGRLKGWLGRADQTTKVRGMFVHPQQIARVVKAYPQVARARLEVTEQEGKDQMTLLCEIDQVAPGLLDDIAQTVRAETRLRADIQVVSPNALPNDGKVIEDKRVLGV